jgi:ABC-2 type transport system permease protein
MRKLWALIVADALVLLRDRAGLVLLYLMPTALVVVVTLVQDSTLRAVKGPDISMVLVNRDKGPLGSAVGDVLRKAGALPATGPTDRGLADESQAREAVRRGQYRALVLVPQDASRRLADFRDGTWPPLAGATNAAARAAAPRIRVVLDPAMMERTRSLVLNALARALVASETRIVLEGIAGVTGEPGAAASLVPRTEYGGFFADLGVEEAASSASRVALATSTQQNVPAWTLFAMFFLVVPLAGQMVAERQSGLQRRILAAPVGYTAVVLPKVACYLVVCLTQFAGMLAIGFFLLPLAGAEPLRIGAAPGAMLAMATAAALAATGYGVAVGTLARTQQQVSTFGAVGVVIAAAVGGIMVPVFVMPPALAAASRFSPLGWGLEGFLELFVRGGGLAEVGDNVMKLLAFFFVCLAVSSAVRAARGPGSLG